MADGYLCSKEVFYWRRGGFIFVPLYSKCWTSFVGVGTSLFKRGTSFAEVDLFLYWEEGLVCLAEGRLYSQDRLLD